MMVSEYFGQGDGPYMSTPDWEWPVRRADYDKMVSHAAALGRKVQALEAEVAALRLSLSEVRIALDGERPEGGIYVSEFAQRVAALFEQIGKLVMQDEHHNALATEYFDNWQAALGASRA